VCNISQIFPTLSLVGKDENMVHFMWKYGCTLDDKVIPASLYGDSLARGQFLMLHVGLFCVEAGGFAAFEHWS